MKRSALALAGLLVACDSAGTNIVLPIDAGAVDSGRDRSVNPCADAGVPPLTLDCTGLYADFASKTVAPNAQSYAPAVPLWSDGAGKQRWIELPAGQTIDVSNPSEWTFPLGTKLFKEFTYDGKRVETRMFQKVAAGYWVHATYAWNATESAAPISYGAAVTIGADAGTWVIPTPQDCDSCHRGRSDRILGFEEVSLGLPGATGLTLTELVREKLLSPPPTNVNLQIGDDGTGLDGPALSWLHVNCGVSCHNANENAEAYGAKMILRLDPATLNGSMATMAWEPLGTTLNVACVSGSVSGIPRILPGSPSQSAVVQLISERGALQMPPIASRFVDTTNVAAVAAWIAAMPPADAGIEDSGVEDTGHHSGEGGRPRDSGVTDTSMNEDATLSPDAGPDASADAVQGAD